jgi:hypothetical protein
MTDRTNAERQRRYIAKLESAAAGNKPTGLSASAHKAAHDVPWEINVDDDVEGYLAAYMEPYGLYVRQWAEDKFGWDILSDGNEEAVDVAEVEASTLLAAVSDATQRWAAVRKTAKQR